MSDGPGVKNPYVASYGADKKFYVDGPAPFGECDYYGGTLYPSLRMDTEEEAKRATAYANIGFHQGYAKAQRDIRMALGIT